MKKTNKQPTLGNTFGLKIRMLGNYLAYAGATVVHATQLAHKELAFQVKEAKLGLTGVDTTRTHRR